MNGTNGETGETRARFRPRVRIHCTIYEDHAPVQSAEVAQVAQVTVRHTVIASGPCRLGDPEQRRPALRPLGYPTDCP